MSLFGLFSMCATFVCLFLGIIVFNFNRKSRLNRIFLLATVATFIYSFSTVMMWSAGNPIDANFWNKVGTIWPFFVALVLNFALIFTENEWIKNKYNYLVLYLPAVAFFLIDLLSYQINKPPIMKYWGYNDIPSGTWIYAVSTIWSAVLPVLAFALCIRYYLKTKDASDRQRRKLITIGFGIPVVTFIVTNIASRSFNLDIPNMGILSTLFLGGFVGYAISRFDLFTFDAALAAENIISTMPDSIILTDTNKKMLQVNGRLINYTGYIKEELIGQPITKLFEENQKEKCSKFFEQLKTKRVIRNQEITIKTKINDKKQVLLSGSDVKSKTGRVIGNVLVIHDITELKQIEERLVKAERLASIGELAGQIGHDLRNPLAGIKNAVYLLERKNDRLTEEKRKESLAVIADAVEDANRIVTSLIEYSSEFNPEPQKCTPKILVENALAKIKIPDRLTFRNEVADETQIWVDKTLMENVLISIIKNALEAIPDIGVIQTRSVQKNGSVEISVSDSGTGIPQNVLPNIFTPLVTTKAKGMGLSLAICKRMVESHGGKITVSTLEGKGSTFTVVLPIKGLENKLAPETSGYMV